MNRTKGGLRSFSPGAMAPSPLAPMRKGMYTYEAGGMIGPGGEPIRPQPLGAQPMAAVPNMQGGQQGSDMRREVQKFVAQNPQQVQQIRGEVMATIQQEMAADPSMNQQELFAEMQKFAQLIQVTLDNPQMYASTRQFLIESGFADEQDLPPQYDAGGMFLMGLIGSVFMDIVGTQGTANMPSMAVGGQIPKSQQADGGVPIMGHEGEYVIPRDVVMRKGTDFFDKMISEGKDQGA